MTATGVNAAGEGVPAGETRVRRVATAAYERYRRDLRGSLALGPGVREWATLRLEAGAVTAHLRATTASGVITAAVEVMVPPDVAAGIAALLEAHREPLHDALKDALAQSLAAAAFGLDGGEGV